MGKFGNKSKASAPTKGSGCTYTMPYLRPGPVYGLAFNFRDPRFASLLAAAGKQGASVFCLAMERDGGSPACSSSSSEFAALPSEKLLPVMSFKDEHEDEDYYSCAWASGEEGEPLLVVGGFCGIVKVLDVSTGKLRQVRDLASSPSCAPPPRPPIAIGAPRGGLTRAGTPPAAKPPGYRPAQALRGHGDSINSITVQPARNGCAGGGEGPREGDLVMTASKDFSIRMWNLKTSTCVMVFAGAGGHTAEITSVDFSVYNGLLLSCGLDNYVKIWNVRERKDVIALSQRWDKDPSSFPTAFVQFPNWSTSRVHDNFVDCVKWFGNNILSKSVDDTILHWCIREDDAQRGAPARPPRAGGGDEGPSTSSREPADAAMRAGRPAAAGKQYQQEADFMVLNTLPFCDCDIWFIKFSMDFNLKKLACGNHAGVVHVWSLAGDNPKLLTELSMNKVRRPIRQTALSLDGRVVAACTDNGEVWTWCPWKNSGELHTLHELMEDGSGAGGSED